MAINAIDQLFRSEQPGSPAARRPSDSSDKRFSNLLDAQSARARIDRPAQRQAEVARRQEDHSAKTVRAERPEGEDRTERGERAEAGERAERTERKGRPERAWKKEAAAAEKAEASDKAAPAEPTEAAEGGELAKAAKKAGAEVPLPADGEEKAAADAPVAADVAPSETVAAPVAVKLDAPEAIAVPVAALVAIEADPEARAAAAAEAAEAEAEGEDKPYPAKTTPATAAPAHADAKPAADTKAAADAKAATTQIALPTSTLAETAKQAEPATEDYADFMLRSAAALPAAEAGKDAVKAEADAVAKEGKIVVTIAQPAAVAAPVAPVTAFAVQAVVSNDNASLDVNLAARAPVDLDDVKAPVKAAEPANVFAQHLDSARAAQATEEPKPVARTPLVPPHEQVAVHIRKAVADGLDQISIRLNPLELGRIDIKLDIGADGSLRAAFAADRQQTLELLKSDSRQLENALSEAGLRADSGGLNFSLRGDNRENAQAFRDMGAQFANRRNAGEEADDAAIPVAAGYARPRAANGRIDLNA
ncbi:MAG: flagellar hook-length control protein FliK [Rhodospirillales bacterium]|nr:flagellar hook-length control protein FliK [Rhodospirillales bacterium]